MFAPMKIVSSQRWAAFFLVCVQAGAIGYLSKTVVLPVGIVLAALVATVTGIRLTPRRETAFWWLTGLFVLFLAKYVLLPTDYRFSALAFNTRLAHVAAEYLLVLEVGWMFARRPGDRLPLALSAMAVIVMVFTYDVQVYGKERLVAQLLVCGFVIVLALYLGACRRSVSTAPYGWSAVRVAFGAVTIFSATAIGWTAADGLYRNERHLDALLFQLLSRNDNSGAVGFSGQARLGSVAARKTAAAQRIALRIEADTRPGYLRGKAFDSFVHSGWQTGSERLVIRPTSTGPAILADRPGRDSLFSLQTTDSDAGKILEVWPDSLLKRTLFAPLKTTSLRAAVSSISVDLHGIIEADALPPGDPYTLFVTDDSLAEQLPPARRQQLTRLPRTLDRRIALLADRLFRDCHTDREKMQVVSTFFQTQFQYNLGIQIPAGKDPLTYFLTNRLPAHCEYFATATAVLLRLSGVPCRYVTGFVAHEKNRYSGGWVARNQDAHAWVEAWDENAGWVIVESTPETGIPAEQSASGWKQFREYLLDRLHRFRIQWRRDGLIAIVRGLQQLLIGPVGGALLILTLTVLLVRLVRRRRRPRDISSPLLDSLHRLLRRMDNRLKSHNLIRRSGETLHQFADRILKTTDTEFDLRSSVASWYRNYASVRYVDTTDTIAQEHVKELERTLPFQPRLRDRIFRDML